MRSFAWLGIFGAAAYVACGGSTTDDVFGGGAAIGNANADGGGTSGGDATSPSDAASSNDATADVDGASADSSVVKDGATSKNCADLLQVVDSLRPQAIECLLGVDALQCDALADDVCCKATVNKVSRGTPAVKNFVAAVAAFRQNGCQAQCPLGPCLDKPTGDCVPEGLGASCAQ